MLQTGIKRTTSRTCVQAPSASFPDHAYHPCDLQVCGRTPPPKRWRARERGTSDVSDDQGFIDKAKGTAGDLAGKAKDTAGDLAGKAGPAVDKARSAYGEAVVVDLRRALDGLDERPGRLQWCMSAMSMTLPPAFVQQRIRVLRRRLAHVATVR